LVPAHYYSSDIPGLLQARYIGGFYLRIFDRISKITNYINNFHRRHHQFLWRNFELARMGKRSPIRALFPSTLQDPGIDPRQGHRSMHAAHPRHEEGKSTLHVKSELNLESYSQECQSH
jgi:hypothetical protein